MVYFSNGQITIRNMEYRDAQAITDAEIEQGWDASIEKYLRRLVAEYYEKPVGYVNIYPNNTWGAFGGKGYPEIVDFAVLEKYRRHGIGTILMDIAEKIAATYADVVYLGVGLHSGYGSAQRMYVKRGYIPDGSGVWYQDKICKPYGECKNDDDLVLYLSKKLRDEKSQSAGGI